MELFPSSSGVDLKTKDLVNSQRMYFRHNEPLSCTAAWVGSKASFEKRNFYCVYFCNGSVKS